MEIFFLGTGAGMPSRERNVTSIALKLFDERGSFWLFDCGEGTQQQILKSTLKLSKLEKLFITHCHGDHIYGLPGLLTSRSNQGVTFPLMIYGPPGLREFVEASLSVSQAHLEYSLEFVVIEEGMIFKDPQCTVYAARLEHRIESFGFRIVEENQPGRLMIDKLMEMGIQPGPDFAKLKKGIDLTLEDGTIIKADEVVGKAYPGRIIAILGDTRICNGTKKMIENADVCVHEATFGGELKKLAYQYHHTSVPEIALLAKECRVKALIMTHVSSRYQGKQTEQLLREAQEIFPNSYIANDYWSYHVPRKS